MKQEFKNLHAQNTILEGIDYQTGRNRHIMGQLFGSRNIRSFVFDNKMQDASAFFQNTPHQYGYTSKSNCKDRQFFKR